jgi:hypothetical protein
MKPTIVFVYNADSGLFNTLTDIAHKIFSPDTYACNLCAITFGNFSIRTEWKEFLDTLDAELQFLHRDELQEKYGIIDVALPAVFTKTNGTLVPWISEDEINGCHTVDDLKRLISTRLST